MAESIVQVTEGSGKKLHTNSRVIGANTVEDEYILPGEYPLASYSVVAGGVVTTTANSHLIQIMAGASLNVRLRRILLTQAGAPAAVTAFSLQVFRVTTAGTGGTGITARPMDSADAAAGASGMTLPTVKGTEGVQLVQESVWLGTAAIPVMRNRFEWVPAPGEKSIIIPAGAANGIVVKNPSGLATSSFDITVEFVETTFV